MYCLCQLCCSVYYLCVNVYCTTATGCQLKCSKQIYIISYTISYYIISIINHTIYHIISYHISYISYHIYINHIISCIISYINHIVSCIISYTISFEDYKAPPNPSEYLMIKFIFQSKSSICKIPERILKKQILISGLTEMLAGECNLSKHSSLIVPKTY